MPFKKKKMETVVISVKNEHDRQKLIEYSMNNGWTAQLLNHRLPVQTVASIVPPRRKGSLTEGYGFWADNAPFNETDYRDKLWQTEQNTW